jgi:uncharacterized membrane protein YfcA
MNEWLALGPWVLAACALFVFLGGLVKGAVAIGLPLVAVPLISTFTSVPQALALLVLPMLFTNVWQALHGGHARRIVARFWPVALALFVGIGIGTRLLVALDDRSLYLVMALVVILLPLVQLLNPDIRVPPRHEGWLGPAVAVFGGAVGGVSGFFGPPVALFLVGLKLPKDLFTAAIAFMFLVGAVSLIAFLAGRGVLGPGEAAASALAVIPAFAGIYAGQKIRARVSQATFEKAVLVVLILIGINLLRRALA